MRRPRNFAADRCCHLVSRIANRAFYLSAEERTRFVERVCQCELLHGAVPYADAQGGLHCAGWRDESAFVSAGVQDHGEGAAGDCEWIGYSTTLHSTKGVTLCLQSPLTGPVPAWFQNDSISSRDFPVVSGTRRQMMKSGDKIDISAADKVTKVIKLSSESFVNILRKKIV